MPRNLPKKVIVTGVVAVLAVAFFVVIFWKLASGVQTARQVLQELQSKIAELDLEERSSKSSKIILETRADDLARLGNIAISREQPVEFIEALERSAKALGVKLALDIDETNKQTGKLVFRLTVEGGEQNVLRYFRLLELAPYDIKITDFNFERLSKESGQTGRIGLFTGTRLSVSLNVRTK